MEWLNPNEEERLRLVLEKLYLKQFEPNSNNAVTILRKRHNDIKSNIKPSEELKETLSKRPKKNAGRTLTKKLKKLGKKKPPKKLVNKLNKKKK